MLIAVLVVLILLATFDLWVGVTNDAVNFLNSAIGSQVAKRRTIYIIATVGIFFGAALSSGMMEVARKGIFDPGFFVVDGAIDVELILMIYLAVMVTDVIFLDLFNTFGLPTSTTVSIVSELFGAALGVAFWLSGADISAAVEAIEGQGVLNIYAGIALSVVVSFTAGALVMLALRVLFTRDVDGNFAIVGPLWAGLSTSALLYFVLFKAAKKASFMTDDVTAWLADHIVAIMGATFLICVAVAQVFSKRPRLVFKFIILFGTGALAAAFAGNDLVNFIGPAVAAGQAVLVEGIDLTAGDVSTPMAALLFAGAVMATALWRSKKAQSVSDTEIRLAASGNVDQRFSRSTVARGVIGAAKMSTGLFRAVVPRGARGFVDRRLTAGHDVVAGDDAPYDLLRATVNLTVAAIVISIGTALKLPLSTTYVAFMAAMGAALADRAWGDEAAAEARITGVLVVMGGWVMTGVLTSMGAFVAASVLMNLGLVGGAAVLVCLVAVAFYRMAVYHAKDLGQRETMNDVLDKKLGT